MRVLHAIRSDGFAGVERHVARLAAAQAEQGHDVTVIGGNRVRMPLALADPRIEFRSGDTVLAVARAVRQSRARADVLNVHMTAAELGATLGTLPTRGSAPMVATRHFAWPRGSSRVGGLAARLNARAITAQIAISHYVADRIDGGSVVVYPGVDSRPDARPAAEREPVVLVVQRLEPEKDTHVAVEAFAQSGLAARGWRLEIAGDGSLRGDLEELARDLGVADAVHFLGSRDDVPALMARSAMLVAPCPVEGLGLSVLEAMAAGLPTVATANGGHLETLPAPGQEVAFPVGNAGVAAAALARLADDEPFRDELARSAQRRQREHFTLASQTAGTDEVYRAALAR